MEMLVTGGTGSLGREVVRRARAAGHVVRAMSRRPAPDAASTPGWATADLATGLGLADAVAKTDVIVHAASDPRGDLTVDVEGTRRLVAAAREAGVGHVIYVSIVGVDRIPLPYYQQKLAAERVLEDGGVPFSILRATQFHSFVDFLMRRAATAAPLVMPVPAGYEVQSVALEDVADRLLRAVHAGPSGLLADFGGPERLSVRQAALAWKEARGVRKPLLPLPLPGAVSAGYRAGYNTLPEDAPAEQRGRERWRDWLSRPIAPGSARP